jgi:hypothetical protein
MLEVGCISSYILYLRCEKVNKSLSMVSLASRKGTLMFLWSHGIIIRIIWACQPTIWDGEVCGCTRLAGESVLADGIIDPHISAELVPFIERRKFHGTASMAWGLVW